MARVEKFILNGCKRKGGKWQKDDIHQSNCRRSLNRGDDFGSEMNLHQILKNLFCSTISSE